jgi:hypothetical protein
MRSSPECNDAKALKTQDPKVSKSHDSGEKRDDTRIASAHKIAITVFR